MDPMSQVRRFDHGGITVALRNVAFEVDDLRATTSDTPDRPPATRSRKNPREPKRAVSTCSAEHVSPRSTPMKTRSTPTALTA
jgi:hypothetical protein